MRRAPRRVVDECTGLVLPTRLPLRGGADAGTIRLVQLCNGRRRLRQVVAEMARPAGADAGSLTGPTLAVARRLVALGFLVPAER